MNWDVAELNEQFLQLKRSGSALSAQMRVAAASLVNSGPCPSDDLEGAIDSYSQRWGGLCSGLRLSEQDTTTESTPDRGRIQGRLTEISQADEALALLRKVEQLRTSQGSESLLDPVRQVFHEITSRLETSPWSETALIQEVREKRHPLCRLVSLVESLHELTDDQWVSEMNAMQQMFGVALSTALARGKLSLSNDSK